MNEPRCETCRYYKPHSHSPCFGYCYRFPPIRGGDDRWPYTEVQGDKDWCGEHRPKEAEKQIVNCAECGAHHAEDNWVTGYKSAPGSVRPLCDRCADAAGIDRSHMKRAVLTKPETRTCQCQGCNATFPADRLKLCGSKILCVICQTDLDDEWLPSKQRKKEAWTCEECGKACTETHFYMLGGKFKYMCRECCMAAGMKNDAPFGSPPPKQPIRTACDECGREIKKGDLWRLGVFGGIAKVLCEKCSDAAGIGPALAHKSCFVPECNSTTATLRICTRHYHELVKRTEDRTWKDHLTTEPEKSE